MKNKPNLKLFLYCDQIVVAETTTDAKKVLREEYGRGSYRVKRLTGKIEVTGDGGDTTSNMNAAYLAKLWGRGMAPQL